MGKHKYPSERQRVAIEPQARKRHKSESKHGDPVPPSVEDARDKQRCIEASANFLIALARAHGERGPCTEPGTHDPRPMHGPAIASGGSNSGWMA